MRVPHEGELLMLWEGGINRHPIDRALLLGAWARPELSPAQLAELPVGALNAALLRLREAWFGSRIDGCVDCERCGERLELVLEVEELLAGACDGDARAELEMSGFRFRVPDSRDLAAVAHERDAEAATLRLLERCWLERPKAPPPEMASLLAQIEAELEARDPTAHFDLSVACHACGHQWTASLQAGELLWDELGARARLLLVQIHALARAYGWTEPEILALSPQRRALYLDMVSG
jgi:hypothetical protein